MRTGKVRKLKKLQRREEMEKTERQVFDGMETKEVLCFYSYEDIFRENKKQTAGISNSMQEVVSFYIGEVKRIFGDHFAEVLCSVHKGDPHLPVTHQFNSPSNSLYTNLGLLY